MVKTKGFKAAFTAVIVCTLIFFGFSGPANAAESSTTPTQANPLVVIGFSGVVWANISEETTPHLWKFSQESTVANVVVRTVRDTTCPVPGWLALGAGQRTVDISDGCRSIENAANNRENHWNDLKSANATSAYSATLGSLGDAVDPQTALAIGPGAGLALANWEGKLEATYAGIPAVPGSVSGTASSDPDTGTTAAAEAYSDQAADMALTVVDLGAVRYPDAQLANEPVTGKKGTDSKFASSFRSSQAVPKEVTEQMAALDARFGALVTQISTTSPHARVIVTNVGDAQSATTELGYFAEKTLGQTEKTHLATSSSTRQPGLVQLTDVYPTILSDLNLSQTQQSGAGAKIFATDYSGSQLPDRLSDDQIRSTSVRANVGIFYTALITFFILLLGFSLVRLRRSEPFPREKAFIQFSVWVAALPVSSLLVNLIPWWRTENSRIALFSGITIIAALIAGISLIPAWKNRVFAPYLFVGAVSAAVLIIDIMTDTRIEAYPLQLASLLGTQPQVGGRFYGLSNATFAIMLAGLVLVSAYLALVLREKSSQWLSAAVLALIGLGAVFIDGSPSFGADFGGPPALIVAFSFLILFTLRKKLTVTNVLMTLAGAALGSICFAIIDFQRPPAQRSHLGRFVQTVIDGDGLEVISRKLSQAFFGLPVAAILVIGVVLVFAVTLLSSLRSAFGRPSPEELERMTQESLEQAYRNHIAKGLALPDEPLESRLVDPETVEKIERRIFIRSPHKVPLEPAKTSDQWAQLPILKATGITLGSALAVGFLINDSGIVVPLLGMCVAFPLWVVTMIRNEEKATSGLHGRAPKDATYPSALKGI